MFISLQSQLQDLEDSLDELHADFSKQSCTIIDTTEQISHLEQEVAMETELVNKTPGVEGQKHMPMLKESTARLGNLRSQLAKLELQKSATSKKLEEMQLKLDAKKEQKNVALEEGTTPLAQNVPQNKSARGKKK